jgi:transcription elongation factor GreB
MSRAFVKELDEQSNDDVIERPQSEFPNYITIVGLDQIKNDLEQMRNQYRELKSREDELSAKSQIKSLEADIRYLEKRIQCALPIDPRLQSGEEIRFGATVELVDEEGKSHSFRIVGEDEADADKGDISWVSPLARELIGKKGGDTLVWKKPTGDLELEILEINYE